MRILILGGTGMMGHMACRVFQQRHEVFATCRRSLAVHPRWVHLYEDTHFYEDVNCLDQGRLEQVFSDCHPDAVLNCIGIVKQLKEANDPLITIPINALLPHELAQLCDSHGARLIHLSTDCVFSGKRGNYRENDIPDPVDLYDRSKLLGEIDYGRHLTIRTSMIGRQLYGSSGLVEWLLAQRGRTVNGYTRAIYSGLTTAALCQVILQILDEYPHLKGVYHVSSDPVSKFELLSQLNHRIDLGISIKPYDEYRCDRSLDSTRLTTDTSIEIPSWNEMLDRLVEDVTNYDYWRQ
jgi:dTDP-4-dehydrorhamnose reductase